MKNRSLVGAAATSFAHLLGIAPGAAKSEDDKDDNKDKAKSEDEDAEDGDDEDKDKSKKSKKAKSEGDDDDADAEDGDEDAEDGDDEDKEQAARKSERARCAAIFQADAAATRPDMAAHLAFNTDLSAKDAIGLLTAAAVPPMKGRQSIGGRMANVKVPNVGASGSEAPAPGSAQSIIAKMSAVYDGVIGSK